MDILEWVEKAKNMHSSHLDTKIKIIGVIGKDCPDHGKGDNINCYLRDNIFPVAASENETCSIRAHYSEDEQILFLVMNGVDDAANIRKCLKTDKKETNYFQAMAESELTQLRMLHFLFISCHFILIFEQTSRIDLEFMRLLKMVNKMRMELRRKVDQRLISAGLRDNFIISALLHSEAEGRIAIPRLLIAFQRNNIRPDVNAARKRELYEKLEKNLDSQFTEILKLYDLIDTESSALCQLNETIPIVHLMNPKSVKRDIVGEMFDVLMAEAEGTKCHGSYGLPSNNSFIKFLEDNFRSEKNEISLQNAISVMSCLQCILDASIEDKLTNFSLKKTPMQVFIRNMYSYHMNVACKLYTDGKKSMFGYRRVGAFFNRDVEPVKARSKEEHLIRFNEATHFIESVVGINSKEAVSILQTRCNDMWQSDMRACESISMMGRPCTRKIHPTFGDPTVPEVRWTAHNASNTMVSTCLCGKKQLLRQEPFSVKEANFDFYESPEFKCCKRLWRYQFNLYQEDNEEKEDIMWVDRESNSLRAAKKVAQREDELAAYEENDLDIPESLLESNSSSSSTDDIRIDIMSSTTASSDSEMYIRPSSRWDETNMEKGERQIAVEHARRLQKLENSGKSEDFLTGVPNSLSIGKLPIFASWHLTALGDSSIYSHGSGLKNQPNFKLEGDYLSPVVVFLDVNYDIWSRDLNKIRSEDFSRKYGKDNKDELARVKLFVGFEYECSRGHRFFVDHNGEPLIYSKGSNVIRESAQRCALGDVLKADLPIRRPCTCRKQPLQSAQLQKVHVVTPKAPVHITVDPKVLIPTHEGVYGTGQEPLELHHSKYYILHLPVVYSGPSGIWMPGDYNPEKQGTWMGGAIKVTYKPVLSFKW